MPAGTLTINVSAEDLAKLKDLPAQVETIIKQSQQLLNSVRSGENPSNAFSGLLGNLSHLAGEASQIPELGALLGPIQDLLSKLPSGALADLKAITGAIEGVLGFFGPLKEALLAGKIDEVMEKAVAKVFDQVGDLFKPSDEVKAAQEGLTEFFDLFGAMMKWKTAAPRPEEAVNLLSRALIGIPHNLLEEPAAHLEAALRPLSEVLPSGSDLTLWRGAPTARLNFWLGINSKFSANATLNWPKLEVGLQGEIRELMNIRAAKDRLVSLTLGNLNRIDFQALGKVHQAIRAVPEQKPPQLSEFIDGLKHQLEGMVAGFEDWEPTPDEMRAMMRGLGDSVAEYMTQSPLGELRTTLVDFQHRLLLAIESLPFRDLAREAEDKLRQIAKALDVLDPDLIRKPIHEFFQQIEDKLHEFSDNAVKKEIEKIWTAVEDALKQIKQILESVRATIAAATDALKNISPQAKPAMEKVLKAVASINTVLGSFDLSEPAAVVIDDLHKLKEIVTALDLSLLPDSAVAALKKGANTLREIDLSGTVNPSLNETLAAIDPTPLIQEAAAAIESVTAKLKLLDPASVVQQLDAPINELLKAVGSFGPEQLVKLLHEALKPVEDAIRAIDFEHLFAPLMKLFAELSAKIDAILDPEVIFKPIEEAFQPVIDLIDAVEPTQLIHLLDPHATGAAEHVGGGFSPAAALSGPGDLLKSALQPVIKGEDELFGFRPGDMLLPVIELHHQIAQAFDRLDDTIMDAAAKMLRDALHGRLSALNPVNVQLRITGAFRDIHAEFDLGVVGTRLRDAEDAYRRAVVAIVNAGRAQLAPADATVAARVIGMLPDLDPLNIAPTATDASGVINATVNIQVGLDLSELRGAFASLRGLEALVPSFLSASEVTAASLRQAIHDLDPAPVRIEINDLFDQLGHKIVGLQSALLAGLEELFLSVEDFLTPVTPATIVHLASQLHAALKEQLVALGPATFKDEVKLIFDLVKKPLEAFDPVIIVTELNALRDQLIKTLEDFVASVLPDPAAFQALIAEMEQFKLSAIFGPIMEVLQPLSELIATLDVKVLLQPLIDSIARIRSETPEIISNIEVALDDLLSAFPEGGPASASASLSLAAA